VKRIQMVSGDEYDALTRAKRFYNWRTGERMRIKRNYRRRERSQCKKHLRAEMMMLYDAGDSPRVHD
jgi:hypothetical protein